MAHSPKREGSPDTVKSTSAKRKRSDQRPNDKIETTIFQKGITNRIQNNRRRWINKKTGRGGSSSSSGGSVPQTTPETTQPINGSQQTLPNSTTSLADSEGNTGVSAGDDTDAPDDPQTPPIKTRNDSQLPTPSSNISSTGSKPDVDSPGTRVQLFEAESGQVTVNLKLGDGEYVLKIEKRSISSSTSTYENKEEEAKQLAQHAGMLLQAQVLRNMGEQLLAKSRASLQCISEKSIPRIDLPDH